MDTSEIENVKICPFCSNAVDPLRAAAVSIVDGKIAYFCSSTCRETFLMRDVDSQEPDKESLFSEAEVAPSVQHSSGDRDAPDSRDDLSGGSTTVGQSPGVSTDFHSGAYRRNRVRLLLPHLIESAVLLLVILSNLLLHKMLAKDHFLLWTTIGGIAFSLFWSVWRERGNGVAISVNSLAVPLGALMLWGHGVVNSAAAFESTTVSLCILLARCGGRIAELFLRLHSGVAELLTEERDGVSIKQWRDNSSIALRIRKVAAVMNWARIPVSFAVGALLLWGNYCSLNAALVTVVILLIIFDSRLLRMITGDAHLKVAILVNQMGGKIRDANAVSQLGGVKTALIPSKDVLTNIEVKVVDWQQCEGAHAANVLKALCEVESTISNRFSKAITTYCREQGAGPGEAMDVRFEPGKGVCGDTSHGMLHCGTREYMLAKGIPTGVNESLAHALEESGRRALFVALNRSLAAVFGIDEQIRKGVETAVQRLSMMGIEPVMITSADMASGHGLGTRIGIPRVIIRGDDGDIENILTEFRESDVPTLFMGSGADFEQNVRHAACAMAAGTNDGESSLADVDMRGRSLADIVTVVEWAIAARRSVRINFFLTLLLLGLGVCFASGWHTVLMALGLSIAVVLVSVGCTFSGPYPNLRKNTDLALRVTSSFLQRIGLIKRDHN